MIFRLVFSIISSLIEVIIVAALLVVVDITFGFGITTMVVDTIEQMFYNMVVEQVKFW